MCDWSAVDWLASGECHLVEAGVAILVLLHRLEYGFLLDYEPESALLRFCVYDFCCERVDRGLLRRREHGCGFGHDRCCCSHHRDGRDSCSELGPPIHDGFWTCFSTDQHSPFA